MGDMTFEQAFQRLEAILERMNAQDIPLEESLSLYEEANGLLMLCHKRLGEAEQRIDIITKNRQGDIVLSPSGQPKMTPLGIEKGHE